MKFRFFLVALFACVAALALHPRPAQAGLHFCNKTASSTIDIAVAVGWFEDDAMGVGWYSKGWWTVKPGECATPIGADLDKDKLYWYYADDGGGTTWAGDGSSGSEFCIDPEQRFTITNDDVPDCTKRSFRAIKNDEEADYTLSLT